MAKKIRLAKGLNFLKICKFPLNKFICKTGNFILTILPKGMRSNKMLEIKKQTIKSFDGKDIKIYIVKPIVTKDKKRPCLVYFHGGAFMFKGAFVQYGNVKKYASMADMVSIYVDYRVDINEKFPVQLQDCYEAYKWVVSNANALGIEQSKIIVGGDSAGGCLAAGVTMLANDCEFQKPCAQFLVYPVLDKRMETESMRCFSNTPMWDARLNKKMWQMYLGEYVGDMLKYASPAEIEDYSVFPKTYIETAEFDCLNDEGVLFYEKLKSMKIECVLNDTKGTVHGYDMMKNSRVFKDAMQQRIEFLRTVN